MTLCDQSKRNILKSTCPSDNHHREFGCPRPKSACPKRFIKTVFKNRINSTCGFWCILVFSNVNCEPFTRLQMLLKIKSWTFSTCLQVTYLIPCRHDDLLTQKHSGVSKWNAHFRLLQLQGDFHPENESPSFQIEHKINWKVDASSHGIQSKIHLKSKC